MTEQEKKITDLHKGLERTEKQELQSAIDDLEWRSRKLSLEVHGVSKTEKENLLAKINEIAARLEAPPLRDIEIVDMHRIPSRDHKLPGIIVRFAKQSTRELWLKHKLKLKGIKPHVYIQESMTRRNRELLWEAKEWNRANQYRYVWHKNGSVLVRKTDGERAHVIRCKDDLRKIARLRKSCPSDSFCFIAMSDRSFIAPQHLKHHVGDARFLKCFHVNAQLARNKASDIKLLLN